MTNHFANYWKIPYALLFVFAFNATQLDGQIEVEPAITVPFTPESLIENVFLGDGIQITSIRFNGKPEAAGYFSNGMEDIGFEEGLLLTTGESWRADRPNNSAVSGSANGSFANSAELERLTDEVLEDVLEYVITFRPSTDSVAFKYKFASEEYPEFGCSCYNDVFAFYIYGSGLDPNGENMATLPNSDLPVSVKTIHPIDPDPNNNGGCDFELPPCVPQNEDLYVDNTGSPSLEYDGFTQTLIASAKVIPCEEYTLKIAIADVQDEIFDSAVFLEAESFSSKEVEIEATGVGLDGNIVEGCSTADLVFSIPEIRQEDYTITFSKIGDAVAGQDFVDFPTSVTIPAGQLSTTLPIETIADQVAEGIESFGLAIEIAPCFPPREIWIPINDNQLSLPDLGADQSICAGETVQLMAQTDLQSSGIRSFRATPLSEIAEVQDNSSNPGNLEPSIFPISINDIAPATLSEGILHSICLNISHPRAGDLDIFLQAPNGRFIELSTDNGRLENDYMETCFTENATTSIIDGTAPFTGDFLPESSWEKLYGVPINGTWNLIVRDDEGGGSGNIKGTMLNWSINFNPDYQVSYAWEAAPNMSCQDCLDPIVSPTETTQYTFTATDSYGCIAKESITINVQQPLLAPAPTCTNLTTNSVTIAWEPIIGAKDYEVNIENNGWESTNNGLLQHQITGLQEGESVSVQVRANSNGACVSTTEFTTCAALVCPLPSFRVDNTRNVSCAGMANGQIQVSAQSDVFFILGTDTSALGRTAVFDQLRPSTYKIVVLEANSICVDTVTATIVEPTSLEVQITESRALSCFGSNDGAISSLATGGTAPYDYTWASLTDPSLTLAKNNNLSNLPPGEYQILVTDANNCTDQKFLPIPEPQALIIDSASVDATCFSSDDGVASVSVNTSFNNLNFLWSNGERTATINNLNQGIYSVSVTNETGCEEVRQLEVKSLAPEIILSGTQILPASCGGANNGTATITATGGVGALTFQWSDDLNQTGPTANFLKAQDYEVIVTDETGCNQNLVVSVPDTNIVAFDTIVQPITCFGEGDGAFFLDIDGDTENFDFNWNDNTQINEGNRSNLVPGYYSLIVSNDNDCLAAIEFTLEEKASINLMIDPTPTSCNADDGIIKVDVIDGRSNYTFEWSDDPNRIATTAENLPKGNYSVTVSDADGCFSTESIVIELKDSINLSVSSIPVLCVDTLGSATVVATGGSGTYRYQWDDPTAQTTPIAQNLPSGDYNIFVTDDNGCNKTISIAVSDKTIPVDIEYAQKDISCFGGTDGAITSLVDSPSDNLQYQWSTGATSTSLANIPAATYRLNITDDNGCLHQEIISLSEPMPISSSNIINPISCFGEIDGSIGLTVTGGTPDYAFTWGDDPAIDIPNRTNLAPGDYQLTISDANNCTTSLDFIIGDKVPINLITDQSPASCNAADGTITVEVVEGNSTYAFAWEDDPNRTTAIASNIPTGNYSVTVLDAEGCSTTRNITLTEKEGISLVTSTTPIICAGELGRANVIATGGNGNYQYSWNDSANQENPTAQNLVAGEYEIVVVDDNGCRTAQSITIQDNTIPVDIRFDKKDISCFEGSDGTINALIESPSNNLSYQWSTGATSASLSNLPADTYQLSITDENGCLHQETIVVSEPTALVTETITNPISCFGETDGTINLDIAGGTPNYTFIWSDNPTLNVPNRTNLAVGDYQLTVSDANNCGAFLDFTITDKAPIRLISDQSPASCNVADGIITVGVIEGNSTYDFAWEDDPNRTTAIANGIRTGIYVVTVSDAEGCDTTTTINLAEKEGISLVTSTTPINCADELGKASVMATGGNGNYHYLWDDPAAQESPTAENLTAGDYTILVLDDNGCKNSMSIIIADNTIPVDINYNKKDIRCFGDNDGQITTLVNSPSNNLQYQWSNGETSTDLINIPADTYQLTITDDNGCTHEEMIIITEPEELFVETILDPITCPGREDGVLTLLPMGGTPPYLYSKDGRRFTNKNEFFDLTPGIYAPAIQDANNCSVPIVPIEVAEALPLTIALDHLTLEETIPQEITPIINNGNGELSFTWSGSNLDDLSCTDCPSPTITPTNSQIYRVNVVDENGCTAEARVRVLVEKNRNIYVPTGFSPNGDGSNDRLTVHGLEGTEILSFKIFDRWGELVFASGAFEVNDLAAGWDGYFKGKPMSTNVFAWIVEARFSDGSLRLEKGHSTLIR